MCSGLRPISSHDSLMAVCMRVASSGMTAASGERDLALVVIDHLRPPGEDQVALSLLDVEGDENGGRRIADGPLDSLLASRERQSDALLVQSAAEARQISPSRGP